ncbi:6998_t:CDS:2 [Rhizophagus irregularis]|nr:6998_t:CDS:2 [Rhizophagus irregularis]
MPNPHESYLDFKASMVSLRQRRLRRYQRIRMRLNQIPNWNNVQLVQLRNPVLIRAVPQSQLPLAKQLFTGSSFP